MIKNSTKIMYILVNIVFLAGILAFSYFNFDKTAEFFCPVMQKAYVSKLVYIILIFSAYSYIAGIAICAFCKSKSDELCNAYQKRHESISIEKDNNQAKIAALQAKIDTLEAALQSALKNKD